MKRLPQSPYAFTLLELLAVMAIFAVLATLSIPALRSLQGSSLTNQSISDLAATLENARAYAMAHHTYVRVGIGYAPRGGNGAAPATVIAAIYATDGSLENDSALAMADNKYWRLVGKPMWLPNLLVYDSLNASLPDTSSDITPSKTNIAAFSRKEGSMGDISFSSIIQFNTAGEAQVLKTELARYIKIAMDQPGNPSSLSEPLNKNPFILRLSGINGSIYVLRKENL